MWGVVKGFQIACNLAGPLGDLTGRGDQSSRKVVHRDLAGPLGDLTGTGVVVRCRTRQGDNQVCQKGIKKVSQVGQKSIVKIHITL